MTETNDNRRRARPYMGLVIAAGVSVLMHSLVNLPVLQRGLSFLLLAAITIGIASRISIKIPGVKSNVSISEVFIFLTMLLFDLEAAVALGAAEACWSSRRITKKPLTVAFNASAQACSTFLTGWSLRLLFGHVTSIPHNAEYAELTMAIFVMGAVQYISNSVLIVVAGALRAGSPILDTWKKYYIWTSISYLAAALAAGMIARLNSLIGVSAFIIMAPAVAIVYLTYLTYLKNVEVSVAQAEQAERHLAELQESEERFRSAFDFAPIGMALVSPDGRWLRVNRSLCEIVGYSEQELVGMSFSEITHPQDLPQFACQVKRVLDGEVVAHQMEKRYLHKEGREVWTLASISLIRNSKDKHIILQIQDITDRKRAEEQLVRDAFHDALTGLPNRAWFMEQLRHALEQAKRGAPGTFAVIFLDLDRFKIINDSIGHVHGDQLLIGIANRLRECMRGGDKVARLGGDEFTILLGGIKDAGDAVKVAERIQSKVAEPFTLGEYETFTTASIGIAIFDPSYERPEDLLRDADTAMYQAKSLGKACHVIFNPGMHARAMNLLQLETDLRRAIDRREFFIQYQPIVSLQTGKLNGFEALIRWRHPERGIISPGEFVGVAEETGLIVPLGRWVLREVCRQMREWQDQFYAVSELSISVNLSSKQFAHSGLIEQIVEALDNTGLSPKALKLEITESVVMDNIEAAAGMLEQLRSLGVELSIDDFGTGYSSLSYLHRLPIDTLKIDRSFVARINENNENREIVRTIVVLAQNLGLGVVAEGVETIEQFERLRELKCDSGQGYLFSKPVDPQEAARLMENWNDSISLPFQLKGPEEEDPFEPIASLYRM